MNMLPASHTPPIRFRVGGAFLFVAAIALAGPTGCDRKPQAPAAAPATTPGQAVAAIDKPLHFRVKPRADTPVVSFTFPEPLSDYKGEAKEVSGEIIMSVATGLRGYIEVKTASVTLGEPEIDGNAHSAMFMNVEKHPVSRFTITGIEGVTGGGIPGGPSYPGEWDARSPLVFVMLGDFTLKGITIPIRVPTTLAFDGADLVPPTKITLDASWEINILKPFEIPGPSTGEAAERVIFHASLELERVPDAPSSK